jgi:RNA polymerase I-specific transcription initiation factor RRN3
MFAKVTKALNFLYLYSIIETNKRVRLSRSALASTIRETALTLKYSESSLQLEAHYAFEPYLLPSSKKWVEELYQEFSSLAPPGMEEDDSSEEEDANESEEELDEDTATEEEK